MNTDITPDPELSFDEQCYALLRLIPRGKVSTYKEIARALDTKAWRAVGSAMSKNTQLVVIPCHRVVRSDGYIGGYANGHIAKQRLLVDEGIELIGNKIVNFTDVMFYFSANSKNTDAFK